jgi:hypothetical protein
MLLEPNSTSLIGAVNIDIMVDYVWSKYLNPNELLGSMLYAGEEKAVGQYSMTSFN